MGRLWRVCGVIVWILVGCGEVDSVVELPPVEPRHVEPRHVGTGSGVVGVKNYERVSFAEWEDFFEGDVGKSLTTFLRSCEVVGAREYDVGSDFFLRGVGGRGDLREACEGLRGFEEGDDFDVRGYMERYFVGLRLVSLGKSKLTGYYVASVRGKRERDERYRYPVHGIPGDMVSVRKNSFGRGVPSEVLYGRAEGGFLRKYYSREEIGRGMMGDEGRVLLWTDDALSLYRLHIQGSGVVEMEDGSEVRLHYAANNGHGYVSLARKLMERGELKRGSWREMGEVLSRYEGRENEVLKINPRYIFFREGEGGGRGTVGVTLEAGYSLAVDPRYIPLGLMVWIEASDPRKRGSKLRRLVVAQDTGAAIKGFERGDLFWGEGEDALRIAERTNGKVGMVMWVPKVWWERMVR